jgi:hypothetical protein
MASVGFHLTPFRSALQCSYHGWRFDGCGACVGVPQDPLRAGAAAMRSPRSGAVSFPTREAQGLLFVYPCADADALEASILAPLPLIPGLDGEPGAAAAESGAPYVRDFPYSFDTLLENLSDPSHVAWSHHGVVGDRRKLARTAVRVLVQPSAAGFDLITPGEPGKLAPQQHAFAAPSLFKIRQAKVNDGEKVAGYGLGEAAGLFIYCTPVEPGVTRIVSRLIVPAGPVGMLVRLTSAIVAVGHLAMSEVYDGDLVFLHSQERTLRASQRGPRPPWRSAYFLVRAFLLRYEYGGFACALTQAPYSLRYRRRPRTMWASPSAAGGWMTSLAVAPSATRRCRRWSPTAACCWTDGAPSARSARRGWPPAPTPQAAAARERLQRRRGWC